MVAETTLLMHFLDDIFPLQYPMYKPSVLEGGRGWLLPLVLRMQPLYHAALSFGAYYRTTALPSTSQSSQVAAKIEQGKHFDMCIAALNDFAKHSCPERRLRSISFITTVLQMVFYEVFSRPEIYIPALTGMAALHRRWQHMATSASCSNEHVQPGQ